MEALPVHSSLLRNFWIDDEEAFSNEGKKWSPEKFLRRRRLGFFLQFVDHATIAFLLLISQPALFFLDCAARIFPSIFDLAGIVNRILVRF